MASQREDAESRWELRGLPAFEEMFFEKNAIVGSHRYLLAVHDVIKEEPIYLACAHSGGAKGGVESSHQSSWRTWWAAAVRVARGVVGPSLRRAGRS